MNLQDLINDIPSIAVEAVCVAAIDTNGTIARIAWVNEAFCQMFATTSDVVEGTDSFAILHWEYVEDFKSALAEMEASGKTSLTHDTLCLRYDGSSFWGGVSHVRVPPDEDGTAYAITFVRDIDDLKNREQSAELALIEHEHLLAQIEAVQTRLISAIKMSPDPFCIFDARDRLVIWNPAFADGTTSDKDTLKKGMKLRDLMELALENGFIDDAVGDEEQYLEAYLEAWRNGKVLSPLMRIQGRDYKVIRSDAPNGDRVLLRADISEHLRQQRELESYAERLEQANRDISEQALHDELTGLGNRRFLNVRLEELQETRRKTGLEIAALHIDLDRFKHINDTMGHAVGDHVLQCVADILRERVRSQDVVARIGGDEFIVLTLCARDSDTPDKLADRLISEICKPIPYKDRMCRIGASVGIARTPTIPTNELITCSDIALYKAKTGGRATWATFDHGDLDTMQSNKRLADDILRGLDEGEFQPLYQPQVNVETGEIVGLEVQTSWHHPERGVLTWSEFEATAKEVHADGKIDAMVFHKALSECRAYFTDAARAPVLGVNLGLMRLMDSMILTDVKERAYEGAIAFELNETIVVEDGNSAVFERLDGLRALGVSIEVDNFGSGRASIVGLRRIAPDRLKIDQRLIEPMSESEGAQRLVSSIIEIGRALDIGVTADGVAGVEQVSLLKELGCARVQGPFFGAPASLDDRLFKAAAIHTANVA
ncbi:MAG: EAL domain-containing protein [Paracoccaceae bacterium]